MRKKTVEEFAESLAESRVAAVRFASTNKTNARKAWLDETYGETLNSARRHAADIKDFVLANVKSLLNEFEKNCRANGIELIFAKDAGSARQSVLAILEQHAEKGAVIVKGKSMLTEEIHLNACLEAAGYSPVETDLGEYIVQLDRDTPSHIVMPIIHKSRKEVAETFVREGVGDYTEEPEELTMLARKELRRKFQAAKVGIGGVNFAVAESGRLVIISNEGNNRLSTTAPPVHIAMMGFEKLIPREADLPLFLTLLSGSATGQKLTSYVHLISGPRQPDEPDGPDKVFLIILDNGRSNILKSEYKRILRCIRCGACLNVCPVYRQASGHAYRHVYSGPLGVVLAPNLDGLEQMGDLAKASSLCGACEEVCPVAIPIPDMILRLRHDLRQRRIGEDFRWAGFAYLAKHPRIWRASLNLLPMATSLPVGPLAKWRRHREAPKREGREFRRWWNERQR